jgi:hypothetical protein
VAVSRISVLIALDGVVHTSDLPVQSFARHVTEYLTADQIRPVIAGMRGFLEGRSEMIPTGVDLSRAEDGYQAVEILARAAGLAEAQISSAHRSSRVDLAASAWAVDPADGLNELLAELAGRAVLAVRVDPGDPAGPAVLDAVELAGDPDMIEAATGTAIENLLRAPDGPTEPERLLVIGARWHGELAAAGAAGCTTALIDRFDRRIGDPTWRTRELPGLLNRIGSWL